MAAIKFLADADLNQNIVAGLRWREPSIDLLGAHEGGIIGLSDPEVLLMAARAGRVVVSHDCNTMPGHFYRFFEQYRSPGLVIIPQGLSVGSAIEALILFWVATDSERFENQVRYLQS